MKKIIHLTDLHIGFNGLETRLNDIVNNICKRETPAGDYVIVITGDLVEDATQSGSYYKVTPYLDRLKAKGFTVLVIPGNHDYGTGTSGKIEYVSKFKKCFFGDSYENTNPFYPILGQPPEFGLIGNIAFIGLDSMEAAVNTKNELEATRFAAEGKLGDAQLERLAKMLKTNDKVKNAVYTVVYLHHHPIYWLPGMLLVDADKLKSTLLDSNHKIDAFLFGHKHKSKPLDG
ncbi:MAG: metallophosphoesterase, partial [Planctomycetes bacterium]|nr:metallophosphoesterase [Planctomycetota bacterium]